MGGLTLLPIRIAQGLIALLVLILLAYGKLEDGMVVGQEELCSHEKQSSLTGLNHPQRT